MLQKILRPVTLSDLESTYRLEERETTDTALKLGTENNMNTPFLSANVNGSSTADSTMELETKEAISSHVPPPGQRQERQEKPVSKRLGCLDTFRGLSLYLMIFVNYGGGGYYFFEHSDWNGLTVADLLFPWFMWMMGVSMSLTYFNFEQRAARSGMLVDEYVYTLYIKAVRRAVVFYAIGLFLNNGFDYGKWRIPGVLQYFAISYLVTAVTILATWEQTTTRLKAREPIIQPLTHFDWPFVIQCYKYE